MDKNNNSNLNYFDDEYQGERDGDQDEETGAQDDDQRDDARNLNSKVLAKGERSGTNLVTTLVVC